MVKPTKKQMISLIRRFADAKVESSWAGSHDRAHADLSRLELKLARSELNRAIDSLFPNEKE